MEPSINVVLLWILFGGTHVGLATRRARTTLVNRLGEWGFIGVFSLLAMTAFAVLIHYFAVHRSDGAPGLGFAAAAPVARAGLFCLAAFGAALMGLALFDYPASAYALAARRGHYEPSAIERITRHGFFAGLGLLALSHALLASHLVGTAFFGCLALFTWLGSLHQDAKLLAQRGEVHRRYLNATSTLPFAAIVGRRQRLDLRGIPIPALIAAIVLPWILSSVHDSIFAADGAYVVAVTGIGSGIAALQAWRAQRRASARNPGRGAPMTGAGMAG